jgi:HAE1 family hydrophobic/amphiphilic exporter-1
MIIALSIPLSLLISMVVMFFAHESLNIVSMLGLVICVGLLVDNSVVVGENIFRLHREGLSRRQACIRGASEIAMAITMATLTTVIVFLPVSLVSGQGQFFLIRLAMPISVSLIASLLIALVFIPLSVYLVLPGRKEHHRFEHVNAIHRKMNIVLRRFYEVTFGNINHFYNKTLASFLNHRLDLVLIILAVFGLTKLLVFDDLEVVDAQEEDQTNFQIHVSASNEYNFDDVKAYFQDCEKVLEQKQDEFGLTGYMVLAFSRGGRLEGWLPRGKEKTLSATQVCRTIAEALPKKPGMKLFYGEDNGMKEEKRRSVYVLRLQGEDAEELERVARDMEPLFLSVKGVLGIKKTQDDTPSELAMVVDREKAAENNVNPDFIAGVISYAIMGSSLPKYNDGGRQIPVRVRYKEENRESLADLKNFLVPGNDGNFLPLANLTKTRMLATRRGVFRRDKKVTHSMTFELDEKDTRLIRSRLDNLKNQVDLPEGIFFGKASQVQMNDDLAGMKFAGIMSILFIYLLMGFLFESFILPLSIILTIPLAGLGVVWIHFLTGKNLDFLGVVGMILLIGVVVNNGIVLIDYVNRLRADGMERSKAILKAADRRFRPIVMTALTTIIGMIPLTVSQPNSLGISYRSFGLTLIGGMTSATFLTLLVVPVFYTVFDDARLLFTENLIGALRMNAKIREDQSESDPDVSETT